MSISCDVLIFVAELAVCKEGSPKYTQYWLHLCNKGKLSNVAVQFPSPKLSAKSLVVITWQSVNIPPDP
ncbi:hypothetical protein SERLADRAFT_384756 [Serpula lacrymans var. lacrymans S7.9]|uniref:Uncharacterized protein n=1 Tax=Serpula lacrymans var. lacrymans (strain S7.9) TaxID=578457 RepID=F8P6K8_SERL9|nr:uncharacterized protein SERLADRAFT_384756 [Serpula lacrymans var. lacrymans S7.9]XP_007322031.1 uncharacterized protein SERLADRAFT_398337 [Serpula lacrymans var. lacrymans S7.9]EGO21074.1 hypothetical protein SERLADRAFT_398337 [Serpula lacrymans var. lacrymans S7.9]EGO26284.1 hypothetical protein SERLADRAFT_384756 [Serpula lacrymans var. lacrymans S7.9]